MLCNLTLLRAFRQSLSLVGICAIALGCVSSPKKNNPMMVPPTPLPDFKPLPDPRQTPNAAAGANTMPPVTPLPTSTTTPTPAKPTPPTLPAGSPLPTSSQPATLDVPKLTAPQSQAPTSLMPPLAPLPAQGSTQPPVGNLPLAAVNSPAAPTTAAPASSMPSMDSKPFDMPPPLSLPPMEPKTQSNADDLGTKPLARACSNELPASEARESNEIKDLLERAACRLKSVDSIEARLTMKDIKEGKPQPVEIVRFQLRLKPYAIRMTWVGDQFKGRDVLYVSGKYDNKMQMFTGKGELFANSLTPLSFSPDDTIIKSRSKRDIRDAGPAATIHHLQKILDRKSFASRLQDRGFVTRSDWPGQFRLIEESVAAGDRELPHGGKRQFFFDANSENPSVDLPIAIVSSDTSGRNVDSMVFDQLRYNRLSDADFDVRKLGK